MGAELGAEAISHLEEISPEGMDRMARAGSIAVILPTTAYLLRLNAPPVREMIDRYGVPIALGSDFNPNAFCLSMASSSSFSFIRFFLFSSSHSFLLLVYSPW